MKRLRIDVTPAAVSSKHTGVERIIRGLARHAPGWQPEPVVWDLHRDRYRALTHAEKQTLADPFQARPAQEIKPEGDKWSFIRKRIGQAWASGIQPPVDWTTGEPGTLLIPFNFTDARVNWIQRPPAGWRIAVICHDIIPWEDAAENGLETAATAPFAGYVRTLAQVDRVFCSTAHTEQVLHRAWEGMNLRPGKSETVHLPLDPSPPVANLPEGEPRILFVSSIAPRKNHEGLLAAAEQLWSESLAFRLVLVGRAGKGMEPMLARIEAMARSRPLEWRRHVSEAELEAAYREAHFTVFPSLQEGFGLPIQESLVRGRPVICADFGAMAETAGEGGTHRVNVRDPRALADAMRFWITDPAELQQAAAEARQRPFLDWSAYRARISAGLSASH